MGEHGQTQLQPHALIAAQQWQVTVRRCTGDELDMPLLHKAAKRAKQVAIQGVEQVKGIVVEAGPILGERG